MDYQSIKTLEVKPMRRREKTQGTLEALAVVIFLMIGIYIIQGIIYALFI